MPEERTCLPPARSVVLAELPDSEADSEAEAGVDVGEADFQELADIDAGCEAVARSVAAGYGSAAEENAVPVAAG